MPNLIHLILVITNDHGRAMRAPTISMVINQRNIDIQALESIIILKTDNEKGERRMKMHYAPL